VSRTGEPSRRQFLELVGALGLPSVALSADSGGQGKQKTPASLSAKSEPKLLVLTAHQTETLGALAEHIVPKDSDPGARDAGAVEYIERVLAGNQAFKLPLYAAGLEGVDQTSRLMFGGDFVRLPFQEQTSVLKAIESGEGPAEIWKTVSSQEFFRLLWNHVLEGFYGPPEEGGNKDYASWKMIGFPKHSGTM